MYVYIYIYICADGTIFSTEEAGTTERVALYSPSSHSEDPCKEGPQVKNCEDILFLRGEHRVRIGLGRTLESQDSYVFVSWVCPPASITTWQIRM